MPKKRLAPESSEPAESSASHETAEVDAPTGETIMVAVRKPVQIAEAKARKSAPKPRTVVVRENLWREAERWRFQLRADGKKESTIGAYWTVLGDFERWMKGQGLPLHVEAVTRDMARSYIADLLSARKLAPKTAAMRRTTMRLFFKWLVAEDVIEADPFAATKAIKAEVKKPRRVVPGEQLEMLWRATNGNDFLACRDLAMMRVMWETGIRRQEVASMRVDKMDLHAKDGKYWIEVTGKRGTRQMGVSDRHTLRALSRYERWRETLQHAAGMNAYWLTYRGALKGTTVYQIVTRRALAAGIPEHLHPHLFRHTWAHELLAGGVQESHVMDAGGWTTTNMIHNVYGKDLQHERAMDAIRLFRQNNQK